MKNNTKNSRESLWIYYKMSTDTTRATLRKYDGDSCSYVDDKSTTDLAAAIYKAWIEKNGWLDYPKLLFLPRGIYVNDGSGCGFGENSERDASYHLINELHYRRIMNCNGYTFWQSLRMNTKSWWSYKKYKIRMFFDKLFHSKGNRKFAPENGAEDLPVPVAEQFEDSEEIKEINI